MSLTSEMVRLLRQPFAPEHIRWKVQTNPKEGQDSAVVVVYVDARTVAAHLDDVAPGQWSTEYTLPPITVGHPALECRLTICGVTRSDVGTVEPSKGADSDTKDLYSDALKRAAVQYGVGAFLYRFPQVRAQVEKFGNAWYITRDAQAELKQLAAAVLSGAESLPRFKTLKVAGYNPGGFTAVTGGHEEAPAEPTLTPVQAQGLHKRLGAALQNTAHREATHTAYAGQVLGRAVASLTELTIAEAQRVLAQAGKEIQQAA